MKRQYFSESINAFCSLSVEEIIGILILNNEFSSERTQTEAWIRQIEILQPLLIGFNGSIFFEYSIPRMGKRIDVVLIIDNVIFIFEFKVGEKEFLQEAIVEKTHILTMLYRSHLTIFSIDNQHEKGSKKNAMEWSTTAYLPLLRTFYVISCSNS